MLSDKEKKALEMIEHIQECNTLFGYGVEDRTILAKTLLNLFEKQSKEIKELKEDNKKLKDRCKELIFEKQELTFALLDSTPNDKIKAKIEELENIKVEVKKKYPSTYAMLDEYRNADAQIEILNSVIGE